MSTPPSEDMLVQRQLRAAEIALETARRRRFETDESLREMRAITERAESALADSEAARERALQQFRAELAAERARTADAEQRYMLERNRRLSLDQQLSAMRRESERRDETARQLASEARVRQLEGELELVSRRAAEFEYGLRTAGLDALRLVKETAARVDAALGRASPPPPQRTPEPRPVPSAARRAIPPAPSPHPTAEADSRTPPIAPRGRAAGCAAGCAVAFPAPELRPEDTPVRWTEPSHWQVTKRRPHEFGASQRPPEPLSAPVIPVAPLELAPNVQRHPEALKPPPVAAILDSQLDSHRLDEALERLRASSAPPEEPS